MAGREEPVTAEPVELRLDSLLFLRNMPAGLDWSVIGHWCMVLRKSPEPVDPPIRVYAEPGTSFYRVADGRHRTAASWISGRDTILAVVEDKVVP